MKVNYIEMRKKSAKFFMNYLSHVFSSQLWNNNNNNNGLKRFRFFLHFRNHIRGQEDEEVHIRADRRMEQH